jgi:hypothetical protein
VRRLAGQHVPPGTHVTRRSLVAAVAMLLLVWTTGTVMAHPMPTEHGHSTHCDHSSAAWTHLFCRGGSGAVAHPYCPHEQL